MSNLLADTQTMPRVMDPADRRLARCSRSDRRTVASRRRGLWVSLAARAARPTEFELALALWQAASVLEASLEAA